MRDPISFDLTFEHRSSHLHWVWSINVKPSKLVRNLFHSRNEAKEILQMPVFKIFLLREILSWGRLIIFISNRVWEALQSSQGNFGGFLYAVNLSLMTYSK